MEFWHPTFWIATIYPKHHLKLLLGLGNNRNLYFLEYLWSFCGTAMPELALQFLQYSRIWAELYWYASFLQDRISSHSNMASFYSNRCILKCYGALQCFQTHCLDLRCHGHHRTVHIMSMRFKNSLASTEFLKIASKQLSSYYAPD